MKLSILSDVFNTNIWGQLLWMLLAFLLGWLFRKWFSNNNSEDCCDELTSLKSRYSSLEKKYNKLNGKRERIKSVSPKLEASDSNSSTSKKAVVASKTKSKIKNAFAKLKEDNLQVIEGIGPKMDEVLKKHHIVNWSGLSKKSFEELRAILDKENPTRYKIINPETWAQQARLANEGKWDELIAFQKKLDKGKTGKTGSTDSKLEKIMIRLGLIRKWRKNDLKAVEGIGPKIAKLFNENGITTWESLSKASISDMNAILEKGGERFKLANPSTWAQQAKLAFQGKWEDLQALQDELNGGK